MKNFLEHEFESIAVVIPTYNRVEATLKAVNSALNQSRVPDEIIIIDDGSEPFIQEQLSRKLKNLNVKLILAKRSNHPGRVRNIGIESAKSKWIAFLDSDDTWPRNKIELQLEFMTRGNYQASCTNGKYVIDDLIGEQILRNPKKTLNFRSLVGKNRIINSSVMINRNLLIEVGGFATSFDIRGVEDLATWFRIANITKWGVLNRDLVMYCSDSFDSIRSDSEFHQPFNMLYAKLDFLNWIQSKSKTKFLPALLWIKLFSWILIASKIFYRVKKDK